MAHADDLHEGDRVRWNTAQGGGTGRVLRKATCRLYISEYEVKASPGDPQFIVRSDNTGALVARRPAALTKIS